MPRRVHLHRALTPALEHSISIEGGLTAAFVASRVRRQPRKRPTVRKPVWATMRWSGRTAWPSMCQPRCSTSSVRVPLHARLAITSRVCAAWVIDGVYAIEDAAGAQRLHRVRHHLPRLGQVEHHAVDVALVDALVAVAQVQVVPIERLLAEEALHVGAGPVEEVLAQLVADDLGAVAQHRHAQRTRTDAALQHAHAGADVGQHADGRRGPSGR